MRHRLPEAFNHVNPHILYADITLWQFECKIVSIPQSPGNAWITEFLLFVCQYRISSGKTKVQEKSNKHKLDVCKYTIVKERST